MTFVEAVEGTRSIRAFLKPGLQALTAADRARITCDGRTLRGSVHIDHALAAILPNDPRWDYAVGLVQAQQDQVFWLEVHPASSLHVDEVLRKARWLLQWLSTTAPALNALPRHLCWIATGTVSFSRASPQARRLAQHGVRFPVKHADLK